MNHFAGSGSERDLNRTGALLMLLFCSIAPQHPFSALTGAKTDDNGGFSKPLPYVFAARRTVGQILKKKLTRLEFDHISLFLGAACEGNAVNHHGS
jgi:hypothetical protein